MIFLNPFYLIGLSLITVPVIIHFWFRKRLKRVPFSSLDFLKKTEARRLGWLRIRELLVLILRCTFVAALFMSLSKPQLIPNSFIRPALIKNRLASVIVIVDNSCSMGYGENLHRAKKAAIDLIASFSPGSEFLIMPLCPREGDFYWTSGNSARVIVDTITLSYETGSITRLLNQSQIPPAKYKTEFFYIGDGQETVFKNFPVDLGGTADFYWYQIPTGSNTGVTTVFMKDPVGIVTDRYSLIANLRNRSSKSWKGKVRVISTDQEADKDCLLDPNQLSDIEFLLPVTSNWGRVELPDDSFEADNTYYFSKTIPRSIQTLLISGSSLQADKNNEFLLRALKPSKKTTLPFQITVAADLRIHDLRKFDAIILNGIDEITENDKIKLNDFLARKGTSVICLLGDKTGDVLRSTISFCADVQNTIVPKGYMTLDWVNYGDPAFSIFKETSSLKGVRFYRIQKLVADQGVLARVSEYPLIVAKNNLCLIASEFIPQNTDIMYKASFVPFLHRLIGSLVYRITDRELLVGAPVDTNRTLRGINGEYLRATVFLKPGFYVYNSETIGVNIDPEEGNLKATGVEAAKTLGIKAIDETKNMGGGDLSSVFLLLALLAVFLELGLLLIK